MVSIGTRTSIFKLSRIGRKLVKSDDPRMSSILPKDIPQYTWAEILEREESDLIVFDIREEIIEDALQIAYVKYMDRQMACFTAHCAAQAWLKMIDWCFYRHDPGEDISAGPRCYIPKRSESWIPDIMPEPSPKDTFSRHDLNRLDCEISENGVPRWGSSTSLDMQVPAEIPSECWFPGKVNLPIKGVRRYNQDDSDEMSMSFEEDYQSSLIAESEVLQKVIDYTTEERESKVSIQKTKGNLKVSSPELDGSLQGAGDATLAQAKRVLSEKKSLRKFRTVSNMKKLPPINISNSIISDCRLRYHRMETQYEVTPEKLDTPPKEGPKRK